MHPRDAPAMSEQSMLELQLEQSSSTARQHIVTLGRQQGGLRKDTETAVERDFKQLRAVIRQLEVLAEDQE